MSKEQLRQNKKRLYEIHNYDPRQQTHNVHHLVYKQHGGSDDLENLSLIPVDLHDWIHELERKIRENN